MTPEQARRAADDYSEVRIAIPAHDGEILGRVRAYTDEPMVLVGHRYDGMKVTQWFPISSAEVTNPEPVTFGAIVIDSEGEMWVRHSDESGSFWINRHGVQRPWRRILRARVVSRGVE